jgi:hypothetical protein
VTVSDYLPRGLARRREIKLVHDIVQTSFEQLKQRFSCIALYPLGLVETPHELPFQKPVISLDFLLLTQPNTIFTYSAPAPPVHAGSQIALLLLDRAFSRLTSNPFEHELHALTTAMLTR